MKQRLKRRVSLLLALVFMFSLSPALSATASAASTLEYFEDFNDAANIKGSATTTGTCTFARAEISPEVNGSAAGMKLTSSGQSGLRIGAFTMAPKTAVSDTATVELDWLPNVPSSGNNRHQGWLSICDGTGQKIVTLIVPGTSTASNGIFAIAGDNATSATTGQVDNTLSSSNRVGGASGDFALATWHHVVIEINYDVNIIISITPAAGGDTHSITLDYPTTTYYASGANAGDWKVPVTYDRTIGAIQLTAARPLTGGTNGSWTSTVTNLAVWDGELPKPSPANPWDGLQTIIIDGDAEGISRPADEAGAVAGGTVNVSEEDGTVTIDAKSFTSYPVINEYDKLMMSGIKLTDVTQEVVITGKVNILDPNTLETIPDTGAYGATAHRLGAGLMIRNADAAEGTYRDLFGASFINIMNNNSSPNIMRKRITGAARYDVTTGIATSQTGNSGSNQVWVSGKAYSGFKVTYNPNGSGTLAAAAPAGESGYSSGGEVSRSVANSTKPTDLYVGMFAAACEAQFTDVVITVGGKVVWSNDPAVPLDDPDEDDDPDPDDPPYDPDKTATPLKYNFGGSSAGTYTDAAGDTWTQVLLTSTQSGSPAKPYTSAQGWGITWNAGSFIARVRTGADNAMQNTWLGGTQWQFRVDNLPSGLYDIIIYCTDALTSETTNNITIDINKQNFGSYSVKNNNLDPVVVTDFNLTGTVMTFDFTGAQAYVNGIEIVPVSPTLRYNFGPEGAPALEGWESVFVKADGTPAAPYSAEAAYGIVDRGDLTGAIRALGADNMEKSWVGAADSEPWQFRADLDNGSYDVTVYCTDMEPGTSNTLNLSINGGGYGELITVYDDNDAMVFQTIERVDVTDNTMLFTFDPGESDSKALVNGIVISPRKAEFTPEIRSVTNPANRKVDLGVSPERITLPEQVSVLLSNGKTRLAELEGWTGTVAPADIDPNVPGTYTFTAKLKVKDDEYTNPKNLTASFKVEYAAPESGFNQYTRSAEMLDRGVAAFKVNEGYGAGVLVEWRLLATEYNTGIKFNVYRDGVKINDAPIADKTNYLDAGGTPDVSVYTVETLFADGRNEISEPFKSQTENFINIPIQNPGRRYTVENAGSATYEANDVSVGDVDGDGRYEIIVKWLPSNSKDPASSGLTSPMIYDCYTLDGEALWRINLGWNIMASRHTGQFMVYDFEQNGKAQIALKTSDGTRVYGVGPDGKFDETEPLWTVGDVSKDGLYVGGRFGNGGKSGHIYQNYPEYLTVFDGATGEPLDTVEYHAPLKNPGDWGDSSYNRSDRFNAGVAYLPDEDGNARPAIIMQRGYYAKTTVAAYHVIDGKLKHLWTYDSTTDGGGGKGNHQLTVGDVDNDGYDEIVLGASCIDHNGKLLYARANYGHGDALHMGAFIPDRSGLQVWQPYETTISTHGATLVDAKTGTIIFGAPPSSKDVGRGLAANITPKAGYEVWANVPASESISSGKGPGDSIYNVYGEVVSLAKPSDMVCNWAMYWDGDLLHELPDGYDRSSAAADAGGSYGVMYKYNWEENRLDTLQTFTGTRTVNHTKNVPSLSADLFGDWREEIILPTSDNNNLRVYSTNIPTDYMIYTLMHDPMYRLAIAWQNSTYNQPPHLSFYLGEDIRQDVLDMKLPVPDIAYTNAQEPDPDPVFVVNYSGFTSLVEGYAANIPVTVTADNPNGLAVNAGLFVDGALTASAKVVNGATLIKAPAINGNTAYVAAWFDGGEPETTSRKTVPLRPLPTSIWEPEFASFADGVTTVLFADNISLTATAAVKIDGVSVPASKFRAVGRGLYIEAEIAPGQTVEIKGVKYPELFPSYSFTFKLQK